MVHKTPKYSAVIASLKELIRSKKVNDRLPPVRQLMRDCQVSQSTLDHALRQLVNEQLVRKVPGSGIYVLRNEVKPRTRTVGIIISNINDPYTVLVTKSLEKALHENNYRMILCNSHQRFKKELDIIHSMKEKIDALILFPFTKNVQNPEYVAFFRELSEQVRVPLLSVNIAVSGIRADFIGFEEYQTFYDVTGQIIKGRPGVQIVYWGHFGSLVGLERFQGFSNALKDCRYDLKKVILVNGDPDFYSDENLRVIRLKKGAVKPVVFFLAKPYHLPKAVEFIRKKKLRIPEDVVIVSVVEEDYQDYTDVPIIAIVKPSTALGQKVVATTIQRIQGRPHKEYIRLKMTVEVDPRVEKALKNFDG